MEITKMDGCTLTDAEGNKTVWVERTLAEYQGDKVFTATFWDANGSAAWDDSFFENFKDATDMDAYILAYAVARGYQIA